MTEFSEEKNKNKNNKNLIIAILLMVCVILTLLLINFYFPFHKTKIGIKTEKTKILEPQAIKEKILNYINKNLPPEQQKAEIVDKIEEKEGLYTLKIKIGEEEFTIFVTKSGRFLFPEIIDLEKPMNLEGSATETTEDLGQEKKTIGGFSVLLDEEICKEDNKPIVYFFGSSGCPSCQWQHPIMEKVMEKFKEVISFHDNMNTQNEIEIFLKYNKRGFIPTIILGCKYYRIGAGINIGEEADIKNLTALICKLTDNQPTEVCEEVKEIIKQIQD